MTVSRSTQSRLEAQGYSCSNEQEFAVIVPWLRFSPAVCTVLMGVGTALALSPLLWVLVPIAVLGALFSTHPFDLVYNHGLRHLTGTQPLPSNGTPRRFACGMAAVWLVGTALAFNLDVAWLGYLLGGLLTAVAGTVSVSHFCIPSTIYQTLFGRQKRRSAA
ncbi:MAG: DUF4395 family protein [SAR202 cluster bacterium]|nr:DUF4395 family protein [SAR202 cluster bacterium]